jgi:hypothetical protein
MLGLEPASARRNGEVPPIRERSRDALTRATESLMRAAAAMRRSSGHPQEISDVGRPLEHVEDALDDLSAGIARLAIALDDDDTSPGDLAWRLRTLHHALRAARDVCRSARSVARSEKQQDAAPRQLCEDARSA